MELKAKYEQRIEQAEAELRQIKNKILRISTLRVLLFAAGIIGTIYFYQAGTPTICLTIAVTFVPFLALVKYHNRLFFRKDWLETCIRVNSDELSALADNYEPFEDGKEFTNPAHRYSFDLDLFGRHSLFQALNRTCTSFGKEKLAEWLQNHLEIKEEIIQRQEATKELAAYSDFRETFRITGLLYKGGRQATAKKLKSGRKHLPISARNGGAARYWESFPESTSYWLCWEWRGSFR